ncbi:hypothetical protein HPB47_027811 [Ixodes persulcatus]|uniref:Uncharacterized protein n=1 Tax=Ixodes persulcatus TaxID=34615 RepID=A0AC60PXB1_IXOPE|nr:hypothetical protein HPB47_027811 [Ixodes persulcatus]
MPTLDLDRKASYPNYGLVDCTSCQAGNDVIFVCCGGTWDPHDIKWQKSVAVKGTRWCAGWDNLCSRSRTVDSGRCSCKAGVTGCCKHAAAVCAFLNEATDETCTGRPQEWGKPSKKSKRDVKKTISDLFPGLRNEPLARKVLEKKLRTPILETGLIALPEQPWLACSPDGLMRYRGHTLVVEIKCPARCEFAPIVDKVTKKMCVDFLDREAGKLVELYETT